MSFYPSLSSMCNECTSIQVRYRGSNLCECFALENVMLPLDYAALIYKEIVVLTLLCRLAGIVSIFLLSLSPNPVVCKVSVSHDGNGYVYSGIVRYAGLFKPCSFRV